MIGTRARITVAAGLLFALLFVILGLRELSRPDPSPAAAAPATPAAPQMMQLAVAARKIETGETLTAELVRAGDVPPALRATTASPAEAIGKVATQPIAAGAPISRSAIGSEDKLALRVPVGMRAISIDTTSEIAVAGLIRPGDRVDIQVVYPGTDAIVGARGSGASQATTLLQMVEVLAVGQVLLGTANQDGSLGATPQQVRNVTLALSPAQVSTLSLAKTRGSIYLSLRNPADREVVNAPVAAAPAPRSAATAVFPGAPFPSTGLHRSPPARAPQPAPIELVVGDRRQIIYSDGDAAK